MPTSTYKRLTIDDIARMAGVSRTTASMVLNGRAEQFRISAATQERVLAGTRSGGVCLNDTITHMIGKDLPFGGLGESGMGAYHGRASFDCFSHRRSVVRRSFVFDSKVRYPPPRISLATLKRAYHLLLGR